MITRIKDRVQKLLNLGLELEDSSMVYKDINFHWIDIQCMSDEEFDKALIGATARKKVIDKTK